jgi:hypothetical protein
VLAQNAKALDGVIEINPSLVIPDPELSLSKGAIKPFQGKVYGHCLEDLMLCKQKDSIDPQLAWKAFQDSKDFIWKVTLPMKRGDERWYGINSFLNGWKKRPIKCMFGFSIQVSRIL